MDDAGATGRDLIDGLFALGLMGILVPASGGDAFALRIRSRQAADLQVLDGRKL